MSDPAYQCDTCAFQGRPCDRSSQGCKRPAGRTVACQNCRQLQLHRHGICDGTRPGCLGPNVTSQRNPSTPCEVCRRAHRKCDGTSRGCQKTSIDAQPRPYVCNRKKLDGTDCSFSFCGAAGLGKHMVQIHGEGKKCQLCGYTTRDANGIRKHLRSQCRFDHDMSLLEIEAAIQDERPQSDSSTMDDDSSQDESSDGAAEDKEETRDEDDAATVHSL